MGNKCPCLQTHEKTNSQWGLLEEKKEIVESECCENSKDTFKNIFPANVGSYGPPTLVSNIMSPNFPNIPNIRSSEEDISDQMKAQSDNVEIYIKNEGEPDEKELFKKKVNLDDFIILKVILF